MRLYWPPERSDLLAQLWEEGLSARAIAERLGVSRNAVIGRITRMRQEDPKSIAMRVDPNHKKAQPARRRHRFRPPAPLEPTVNLVPIDELAHAVNIVELNAWHCRYPVQHGIGETLYCGRMNQYPQMWCAYHQAVCYRQLNQRQSKVLV